MFQIGKNYFYIEGELTVTMIKFKSCTGGTKRVKPTVNFLCGCTQLCFNLDCEVNGIAQFFNNENLVYEY